MHLYTFRKKKHERCYIYLNYFINTVIKVDNESLQKHQVIILGHLQYVCLNISSKSGEVLASRSDFKMNTASVHSTGTLLLDMTHLALLERSLQISFSTLHGNSIKQFNKILLCITSVMFHGQDCVEEFFSLSLHLIYKKIQSFMIVYESNGIYLY